MPAALFLIAAAVSAEFADLDAIDRQVAAFTGAGVGQAGGAITPVDRRLRLQACHSGMALSWRTPAQDAVVVQCGDAGGWRIFVPVRSAVAATGAGQGGPIAVARGDAVSIAVQGEGFTVSQPGEAMESGPVGGWIKVRAVTGNIARGDVMRARIERPGLVTLPLP